MRAVAALVAVAATADALRLGHVDVVLVGPQYASNVGQVCRLAACFGVGHLRVVAPEYDRAAEATYERRFAMPQGRVVLNERSTEHADLGDALRHADTSVAFSRRSGASRPTHSTAATARSTATAIGVPTAPIVARAASRRPWLRHPTPRRP